jgi:hypothetical protein
VSAIELRIKKVSENASRVAEIGKEKKVARDATRAGLNV